MDERLASAVAHWKAWFGRRDEVAARVVPEVVRWEWSTGVRHSLMPFRFERYPGRGRVLKEPPRSKAQHHEYGLGSDGRFLVERVYDYREHAFESYVLHGDPVTALVEFGPKPGVLKPQIPIQSARLIVEDGHAVRFESFRLNGYTPKYADVGRSPDRLVEWLGPSGRFLTVEEYRYDGQLVQAVEVYGETPGLGPHRYTDRFSYDVGSGLAGIDRVWADGTVQTVYRPRRRGQGIDDLRRAAVVELVPAVVECVRAAAPGEPVYCLELSYQEVMQYFPPLLTLGFERERARIREPDLVFRPMLSGGRTLELPNPDSLAACRQFDQEVRGDQQWKLGERMLREAAAELTGHSWTGVMDVTDDFVSFAAEPEFTELDEALAASAPAQRIAEWKARGWL